MHDLLDSSSRADPAIIVCAAARAAVAAYDAEAEKDEPGDVLPALYGRERLALVNVAATRARTPRGISEKALLLNECAELPDAGALTLSIAEDALGLVREMIGEATGA